MPDDRIELIRSTADTGPSLTIYPRPQRFSILADQCAGIIIKPDHHPVLPLVLLGAPHHNRVLQFPPLDLVDCGGRVLRSAFRRAPRFLHHHDDAVTLRPRRSVTFLMVVKDALFRQTGRQAYRSEHVSFLSAASQHILPT